MLKAWDITRIKRLNKDILQARFEAGTADCSEYIELIQNVVDNRSTPEQELYLKRHLKMCLKCLNKLNLDLELKKAIQHKVRYKDVPVGLANSIRKKISNSV
ncbi:hypothetical protein [Reichenbachiella versicolor]|uniref:hypothetical protein n=1 Tax=Reichenbachiella versicolor TaxID=1821036 RepID=UPI000D6E0FAF|nr:hypothetical protein [Reichenbachiella versicolor]